jgi:hypothetical protein
MGQQYNLCYVGHTDTAVDYEEIDGRTCSAITYGTLFFDEFYVSAP